jgi:hypothetical protein
MTSPIRLLDLEPQFCQRVIKIEPYSTLKAGRDPLAVSYTEDDFELVTGPRRYRYPVDTLAEAHGISFLCPKCIGEHGGHSVVCWFEGRVPDDEEPGPGRWNPTGTGYSDLSFVPGAKSNSVQLRGGCNAHFLVTNGLVKLT